MGFKMVHANINVTDMEKSLAFYSEALGLREVRRKRAADDSFEIVYLGDGISSFLLEFTWLADKQGAYDLGDNESHIAFATGDFEAAHQKHQEMGCICYENPAMGIYFIHDPDDYWLEVVPEK